jgi:hypothetical protein
MAMTFEEKARIPQQVLDRLAGREAAPVVQGGDTESVEHVVVGVGRARLVSRQLAHGTVHPGAL